MFYLVQSVTPQAAANSSYISGHFLCDSGGSTDRKTAQQTADIYNHHAMPGVSYDLLECDDSMDCGLHTMADVKRMRNCSR